MHDLIDETCPPTVYNDCFPDNFQQNEFFESPFSEKELNIAISILKIKSSPGLDKIDYNIIQQFPQNAKIVLLHIYNKIISTGFHSFIVE